MTPVQRAISMHWFALLILFGGCLAACMTGCVAPAGQPADVQPDPFYCPPECIPHDPRCPPRYDSEGIEIGADTPHPIDSFAANETKGQSGNCLNCVQPHQQPQFVYPQFIPQQRPPLVITPQPQRSPQCFCPACRCCPCQCAYRTPTARVVPPANNSVVKEGRFQCERCKKPTVGRQWHEVWSDDGKALTCMCTDCFIRSTPRERETVMRQYLKRVGIDIEANPLIKAAVIQASRNE